MSSAQWAEVGRQAELSLQRSIALPDSCYRECDAALRQDLCQSRAFTTPMFANARSDIMGKTKIVLRASLPSMRDGFVEVQQIDCHHARTVRVPGFNDMPSSSSVLMATRVGRNSATITGLLALSAQTPRKSSCSRNAA